MDKNITTYSIAGNLLHTTRVREEHEDTIDWPKIAFHVLEALNAPHAILYLIAEGSSGPAHCAHCAICQLTIADTHSALLRLRRDTSRTLKLTAIVEPLIHAGTPIRIYPLRETVSNCIFDQISLDRFHNPYIKVHGDPNRPNETIARTIADLLAAHIKSPIDCPILDPPMEPIPAYILRRLLRSLNNSEHGFNPCAACLQDAWNTLARMECLSCNTIALPCNGTFALPPSFISHTNPTTCRHTGAKFECHTQTTALAFINFTGLRS